MRLLRPQDRIVFSFSGDEDMPADQRPRLIGKVLSVSEARRLQSVFLDGSNHIDASIDAVMIGLTGWENVIHPKTGEPIEFSKAAIGEWLTIDELLEVIEFLTGRLTADERKKSESQP